MELTADQLSSWNADGFLVLPGFYSDEQCLELRARALSLMDEFNPTEAATIFSTTDRAHAQDDYFLTSGGEIRFFLEQEAIAADGSLTRPKHQAINKIGHAMHDLDPTFERFSRVDDLAALVAQVGLDDPLLLQSMYICKPPRVGGEVVWHTDHTFLWTEPQSVLGFWVAIDDATVENGCLWAIPGGHRLPVKQRFRRSPDGIGTVTEVFDDTEYDISGRVPLEAKRGTLVVLHGTLPHWSAPNRSDSPRHAYTLHMVEGGAHYPADNWLQRDLPLRGF